ncbi:MAG TPA: hypothetical protein VH134_17135 [Candidatus Dormibacteraeota bacterium]|nr:hypothetical protein [Candidatus Dormibacteraeota bacterium]
MDQAKARYFEGELVDVEGVTGWITAAADAVEWLSALGAEPVSVLNERIAGHPMRARLDAASGELPGRRSWWLAGALLILTINVDGQIIAVVREVAMESTSAA